MPYVESMTYGGVRLQSVRTLLIPGSPKSIPDRLLVWRVLRILLFICPVMLWAHDPVGSVEGTDVDASGGRVAAQVTVINLDTGRVSSAA